MYLTLCEYNRWNRSERKTHTHNHPDSDPVTFELQLEPMSGPNYPNPILTPSRGSVQSFPWPQASPWWMVLSHVYVFFFIFLLLSFNFVSHLQALLHDRIILPRPLWSVSHVCIYNNGAFYSNLSIKKVSLRVCNTMLVVKYTLFLYLALLRMTEKKEKMEHWTKTGVNLR